MSFAVSPFIKFKYGVSGVLGLIAFFPVGSLTKRGRTIITRPEVFQESVVNSDGFPGYQKKRVAGNIVRKVKKGKQ